MSTYYFDSSAMVKNYQSEKGTQRVQSLLSAPDARFAVSRLSVVEVTSALAKRVRIGQLSPLHFKQISQQFRKDVALRRWGVVNIRVGHYRAAVRLVSRLALKQGLRSLDALQLAVVLSLNLPASPITFVCADQALCTIAAEEGLAVINPETP